MSSPGTAAVRQKIPPRQYRDDGPSVYRQRRPRRRQGRRLGTGGSVNGSAGRTACSVTGSARSTEAAGSTRAAIEPLVGQIARQHTLV